MLSTGFSKCLYTNIRFFLVVVLEMVHMVNHIIEEKVMKEVEEAEVVM